MRGKGQLIRAVVVVVAMVAAVAAVRVMPAPEKGESVSSSQPHRATAAAAEPSSSSTSTATDGRSDSGAQWEKVARSFIHRYGTTTGGRTEWLTRLRPVVSHDVYDGLRTVRLANLPSGRFVEGEVLSRAEVGGTVRFPLRGGSIGGVDVTVSVTDEGTLRVTGFIPVSQSEVS